MIRRFFFYCLVLSVPGFFALIAWQSSRYGDLERELKKLEKTQEEWVENNKRMIAGITFLSSPERIEHIARDELGLQKKRPEEVMQISISETEKTANYSAVLNNAAVPETAYRSVADYFHDFGAFDE
jgi:cell division protein FtsL